MYYTQEQIDRANQADLVSFLQSQGEQLTLSLIHISRIRRFAFWIFRFSSPFSVATPFFSIWQAATPMWTVGSSSIPLSALLLSLIHIFKFLHLGKQIH